MADQLTFKRYELKYLLTRRQKELLLQIMAPYMQMDSFGRSTIRNIYYDTQSFRLIRRSMERPCYKEKLRVRSYCQAQPDKKVFVELKKKYESVVYKRRLTMTEAQACQWLRSGKNPSQDSQIAREVEQFCRYYGDLRPAVFLSYEREAFFSLDGSDFRVTFDDNILARQEELSLCAQTWGQLLLPENTVLMEIKTSGGIPLWMTHFLTEQRLPKTSFSKYGTAYKDMIFPMANKNNAEVLYA